MGKSSEGTVDGVILRIPMLRFAIVTVSLPLISLTLCFVTAVIFQFDDVNDTQCNVTNFIPSISAVTGITPQTYLWRICVALHSAPRFAVAIMYFNIYKTCFHNIDRKYHGIFLALMRLNYWLNTVENASLVGVTYISNRENYPVHEKIFIVFMVTSLCYMLLNTILFRWSRGTVLTKNEQKSFKWKIILFVSILLATAGLLYFFALHRLYCKPSAFSWFSFCEYVIAYTNMGYHITAYLDFKHLSIISGNVNFRQSNGAVQNNNKKKRH